MVKAPPPPDPKILAARAAAAAKARDVISNVDASTKYDRGPSWTLKGREAILPEHFWNSSPGPVYNLPEQNDAQRFSFSKGQRTVHKTQYDTSSNDLLGRVIHKDVGLRFLAGPKWGLGYGERGNHKAANDSPGPVYDPNLDSAYKAPLKFSFLARTKPLGSESQTPPNVCSNSYPLHDESVVTTRFNRLPVYTFSKGARVPDEGEPLTCPGVYELPAGIGDQPLSTKASPWTAAFGRDKGGREGRAKLHYVAEDPPTIAKAGIEDVFKVPQWLPMTRRYMTHLCD